MGSSPEIEMGSEDDVQSFTKEDMVWREIRRDASQMGREGNEFLGDMDSSELLAGILEASALHWHSFEEALADLLASKLSSDSAPKHRWRSILLTTFTTGASSSGIPLHCLIKQDIIAIKERDPACPSLGHAFLYFKGYHGIQVHRVANWLWQKGQRSLASLFQSRTSEVFGMDIHPAAQLGSFIMIDHATGVVIGETARVGNGCTLLHGVTLGGNGKQQGDRHPKLGKNVLVGAGASILGNVTIGDSAKIGASAVVLSDIPPYATAVGCPAKVIGRAREKNPASALDHQCQLVQDFRQSLKGPLWNVSPPNVHAYDFVDQLQNMCGLEVPEKDGWALFLARMRSNSQWSQKQANEMKAKRIESNTSTCVCLT